MAYHQNQESVEKSLSQRCIVTYKHTAPASDWDCLARKEQIGLGVVVVVASVGVACICEERIPFYTFIADF